MLYIFFLLLFASPQDAAAETTIHLPEWDLHMTFPVGWEVKTEDVTPMAVVAQNAEVRALALVAVTPVTFKSDDRNHLDENMKIMKAQFETLEVHSQDVASVAGVAAEQVTYTGQQGTLKIQYRSLSFHRFTDQYLITFAASSEKFDNLKPQFDAILENLKIHGPRHTEATAKFLVEVNRAAPDYAVLEALLKQGADIDGISQEKIGALFTAVRHKNSKLVQWLINNNINLNNPHQDFFMISLMATPPIRALFKKAQGDAEDSVDGPKAENPELKMQWVSNEAQLFAGIHNGTLADVQEAVEKGANLTAVDDMYKLTPIPLIKKIIAEFDALALDASKYRPIETWLTKNVGDRQKP